MQSVPLGRARTDDQMKVLLSAYSCAPGKGSEQGVGWNFVRQAARFHGVWVLTHEEGHQGIKAALASEALPSGQCL